MGHNNKIQEFKQDNTIQDIAFRAGYKKDKAKSSVTSPVFKLDSSEVVVSIATDGFEQFFERGTGKKGDAVDFCTKVLGYELKEVLNSASSDRAPKPKAPVSYLEKKPKVTIAESIENATRKFLLGYQKYPLRHYSWPGNAVSSNYLTAERKIDLGVISRLGRSFILATGFARFKTFLRLDDKWKHTSHITYGKSKNDGRSNKYNAERTIRGLAIIPLNHPDKGMPKKYIFCENPIDGLSYVQKMGLKNYSVVATCGTISELSQKSLAFFKEKEGQKIVVKDNDEDGTNLANQIYSLVGEPNAVRIVAPPEEYKDYNQYLIAIQQQEKSQSHSFSR